MSVKQSVYPARFVFHANEGVIATYSIMLIGKDGKATLERMSAFD